MILGEFLSVLNCSYSEFEKKGIKGEPVSMVSFTQRLQKFSRRTEI